MDRTRYDETDGEQTCKRDKLRVVRQLMGAKQTSFQRLSTIHDVRHRPAQRRLHGGGPFE